jgi:hypothetical protein
VKEAISMRAAWLGVLAVALAGCSLLPPPPGIQLVIPATAERHALPVTVVDHAGIVRTAAATEPWDATGETVVLPELGRDNVVRVAWMGGDCDDRAVITVDSAGAGYAVTVDSQSSASECSAVGVLREIRLTLSKPIGADAFEVFGP